MGDPAPLIRPASIEDAAAIAAVHVTSWREAYAGLMPDAVLSGLSIEDRTRRWVSILEGRQAVKSSDYVAEVDGEIVGFGSCGAQRDPALESDGYTGEIYALYVLARAQRRGLGTALMRTMSDRLSAQGRPAYGLWVLKDNSPARAFYERLGGRPVAEKIDVRDFGPLVEVAYGWNRVDAA